ncbi:MAG: AAA family ATPase [Actinomycetota bacterium]
MTGRIILLNGVSSAGKSTVADALDRTLNGVWMHTGVDMWLETVRGSLEGERLLSVEVTGDPPRVSAFGLTSVGFRVLGSTYHAYAALARLGNDVIIDDVIFDARVLREAVRALTGVPVLFVGVRCPIGVAEEREAVRGDRRPGLARIQDDLVHAHGTYDLEIDTSATAPEVNAELIKVRLEEGPEPVAFARLRSRRTG